MRAHRIVAAAAPLLLLAPTARAAEEVDPVAWHLGLEVVTSLPVDVAGRISLEMPYRLRFSTSFGVLPKPYVQLIDAVLVAANAFDQATADVIAQTLGSSFVWRAQIGWRPLPEYGFYFDAGYSLATLGGSATGEDVMGVITGQSLPATAPGSRSYDIRSTLHLVVAEVGWEQVLVDYLVLRGSLGFAGTVAASTKIKPAFTPVIAKPYEAFAAYGASYLDDQIYEKYVFAPTIGLGLGGRFF